MVRWRAFHWQRLKHERQTAAAVRIQRTWRRNAAANQLARIKLMVGLHYYWFSKHTGNSLREHCQNGFVLRKGSDKVVSFLRTCSTSYRRWWWGRPSMDFKVDYKLEGEWSRTFAMLMTSRTAWMDNIKTWTGLSMKESIRMTEDRDKWRKYVHGVTNPRIEDG